MNAPPSPVRVLAAVIRRRGRFLVGRRPEHKRHGGLFEFPGGKVHPGEADAEALARELVEELGLTVGATGATLFSAADPGSPFHVHFVAVRAEGDPLALEHRELVWATAGELAAGGLELAPCDARFVAEALEAADRGWSPGFDEA